MQRPTPPSRAAGPPAIKASTIRETRKSKRSATSTHTHTHTDRCLSACRACSDFAAIPRTTLLTVPCARVKHCTYFCIAPRSAIGRCAIDTWPQSTETTPYLSTVYYHHRPNERGCRRRHSMTRAFLTRGAGGRRTFARDMASKHRRLCTIIDQRSRSRSDFKLEGRGVGGGDGECDGSAGACTTVVRATLEQPRNLSLYTTLTEEDGRSSALTSFESELAFCTVLYRYRNVMDSFSVHRWKRCTREMCRLLMKMQRRVLESRSDCEPQLPTARCRDL